MKKSYFRKIGAAAVMAGAFLLTLSGCGKSSSEEQEQKEFAYVAEYPEADLKCEYISQAAAAKDILYLMGSSWEEDTGSTFYFYRYDMAAGTLQQLPIELGENSSINSMTVAPDGNVAMAVNTYTYDMDENGEASNWQEMIELWSISGEDGSVLETRDLKKALGDESVYISNICLDAQGNYYLTDGEGVIYVLDKELDKLFEIPNDNWINQMFTSKEGDVYVSYYGAEGVELRKIELLSQGLSEKVEGADDALDAKYYGGESASILLEKCDELSLFDFGTNKEESLFCWLDVDVNSNDIMMAGELSDGRIWAVVNSYRGNKSSTELVIVKKVKASEVPVKEELVYGALWIGSDMKQSIIDFNKSSNKYRITVKEYGEVLDDGDALTRFNTALTSADCPDMIDLSSINYVQYAKKGIFEDLYPYMEKSGMKQSDYLENVLEAFEIDGKLYGMTPEFYVNTTLAKQSQVGDITGWTLSEMLDFAEKNEPQYLMAYGSRTQIFYYCVYNSIDEFIDWETGECHFDSDEFARVLEFAAKLPVEYEYDEEEGLHKKILADKVLLMSSSISSVQEYQMMNGMFGEAVSFVGYPNSERKGNLLQPVNGSFAISARSDNKEGAWEFLKTMFSEEYQDSLIGENSWGFPVRKSSLEKKFEQDMTPTYYEDENGVQVEEMKTSWGYDDFELDIYAATKEEVDAVRELIASADKLTGTVDEQLVNIVMEEAEAFFSGQKSARDAAAVIQNRIQIYVNENR